MALELRNATKNDAPAIRRLIRTVGINPFSLNWRRFVVIVNEHNQLAACGQIKLHGATRELASIAVAADYRGQGLARQVIAHLMQSSTPPLYLTCRWRLTPFYEKFGFRPLKPEEMPAYFKRLYTLFQFFKSLKPDLEMLQIMGWYDPAS